jgi:hypothetical protein
LTAWTIGLLLAIAGTHSARAQAVLDAALRDRVLQLVDRLDAPTAEQRESATTSLIKLGPKILPLLPDPATAKTAERKERLERVRTALRAKEEDVNTGASKITITGKAIRLSEAVQQLQRQSGNAVTDLREQMGADVTNPGLDLDLRDKSFFEALDEITRLADVGTSFTTGDGSIGIMPGSAGSPDGDAPAPRAGTKPILQYMGPFRIELLQVGTVREFRAANATTTVQIEAAWEPRLRPMLLKLKYDRTKILDDQNREVKPQSEKESDEVVIRPENPAAPINLNLIAPARDAKKLSSLRVEAEVTIPAGIKVFKFPSLAQKDVTTKQGDVSVILEDTVVDEQVWKVNMTLVYPGEGPAFESYRQGLFNNRLWLQRADGSRFEHNGGYSNTSSDGGKLGFEYLFVDVPGRPADYQLVYETPSKVITIPLVFEFKDIPLP